MLNDLICLDAVLYDSNQELRNNDARQGNCDEKYILEMYLLFNSMPLFWLIDHVGVCKIRKLTSFDKRKVSIQRLWDEVVRSDLND